MPLKFLSVQGKTTILEWFTIHEVVSEYVKSIFACTENTLEEYKRLRRIRHEYFAVYGENADRDKSSLSRRSFVQNPKKSDPKSPS